jgi:hypothetical protein
VHRIAFICASFVAVSIFASGFAFATERHITCDMVRAYVARVGLGEARQVAKDHGITVSEERVALRCLDSSSN